MNDFVIPVSVWFLLKVILGKMAGSRPCRLLYIYSKIMTFSIHEVFLIRYTT